MISITSNPAQKLAFGVASATTTFTTDATPAVQTTANIAAGQGYLSVASSTGMLAGDFLAAETGNTAGTGPWVSTILGSISATNVNTSVPSSRVALTNGMITRFERIETRYKAKKVTLTNLTNGDVHVWDTTLNDNQAYKTSNGATTTLTGDGILNRSNCIAIHPNLLPPSSSFSMKSDYDYRDAAVTDTTAPFLTFPNATPTSSTAATGAVTTDEANGTLFYTATTSATATATQVQAGASKAVTVAGAQSVSFTGLPPNTVLYPHYVQVDASNNVSNVANGAAFTTPAAASTVTSVTVTPPSVTIGGGGMVDFDWVVQGTNSPSQVATVSTTLGTINSAGVVTAPAATTVTQTGTVTVTSVQDTTKSGTATFTILGVAPTPDPTAPPVLALYTPLVSTFNATGATL